MNYLTYQEILENCENIDNIRRGKLLRIYLHIPSLPKLRALQASLVELKRTSKLRNGSVVRL
jgi:hypothetical protein